MDTEDNFAKTRFELSVGGWSARIGGEGWFFSDLLGLSDLDLSAHNPKVVGSSPSSATIETP